MVAGDRRSGGGDRTPAGHPASRWLFRLSEFALVGLFASLAVVLLWRFGVLSRGIAVPVGDVGLALAVVVLVSRLVARIVLHVHGQSR